MITANCCAAASLVTPIVLTASLSRSTAQKSQPRLDGLSSAASHGVLQCPSEQTVSSGQDSTKSPAVPSELHRKTSFAVGPPQYSWSGTHTTHPSAGSQTSSGPQATGGVWPSHE